jgi:predicted nucleotidyltransferase
VITLVEDHTIYAVVVGSRAYGLAGPDSDHDRRGVYAAPTEDFWRLDKPPTHLDGPQDEQFSWELERFCTLALQSNPTVLECLWSPIVESITDDGHALLELRHAFLSRRVADSYGRYARDQFRKLDAHRDRTGEVRHKQAMHMLRLLIAGAHVLRTGNVLVDVAEHRNDLLAVRTGDTPYARVRAWAEQLVADLDAAATTTTLPHEPDRDAVDDLLTTVRRRNMGSANPARSNPR